MTVTAKPQVAGTATTAPLALPYSVIPRKQVHWFWEGFIPFRHVTLVIGNRGTSKGITTLDLAARMTRHDPAPGEAEPGYPQPLDVIVIAGEDDQNESVAGRLEGAQAVLDRVHDLTIFPDGGKFTVPADIPAIAQAIHEIEFERLPDGTEVPRIAADGHPHKVGMVILDPLLALAESDMTRRGQARPVMEALEHVAKAHHLVILLTHHTNADGKAAGSRGIVETVRNEVTLARLPKAPEDSVVRLCTVTKTNIGQAGKAERYALAGTVDLPRIVWACEVPPEDDSRGYDVEQPATAAEPPGPPPAKACAHPWRTVRLCQGCPRLGSAAPEAEPQAPAVPAPKEAPPPAAGVPFAGIPEAERYRALWRHRPAGGQYGTPAVIDDYSDKAAALVACEHHAGAGLQWSPVPEVAGLEAGAVSTDAHGVTRAYSVLDRWQAMAKARHGTAA